MLEKLIKVYQNLEAIGSEDRVTAEANLVDSESRRHLAKGEYLSISK